MGLVVRDDGWRLPDWLWERIERLLPAPPPHPLGRHRPRVPDRDAMDAILLVLRTGMRWNVLNATGVCSSSSAHQRFQEWEQVGVFHEIWRQGLVDYDEIVGIDWAWLAADGDRGYDYQSVREAIAERGFTPHIRTCGEEHDQASACIRVGDRQLRSRSPRRDSCDWRSRLPSRGGDRRCRLGLEPPAARDERDGGSEQRCRHYGSDG